MVNRLMERFKGTKALAKLEATLEAEANAELQERRSKLVEEITHIRAQLSDGYSNRTQRIQDANAEVAKAMEGLTQAQREQSRIYGEVRSEVIRAEQEISQREPELRRSCPEAVGNFIDEVDAQHHSFRSNRSTWPTKIYKYRQNNDLRAESFPDQEKMTAIHQAYRDARIATESLLVSDGDIERNVEDLSRGLQVQLAQIRQGTETE